MTVPFNLHQLAVAAVVVERARREEQEAEDQRYATLRRKQAQFRSLDDEPLLVDEPMTDQNHPITPPPELVGLWRDEALNSFPDDENPCPCDIDDARDEHIATQAARWGADQELDACCGLIGSAYVRDQVRAARRPKPPSLKAQALAALKRQSTRSIPSLVATQDCDIILKALEQLDD